MLQSPHLDFPALFWLLRHTPEVPKLARLCAVLDMSPPVEAAPVVAQPHVEARIHQRVGCKTAQRRYRPGKRTKQSRCAGRAKGCALDSPVVAPGSVHISLLAARPCDISTGVRCGGVVRSASKAASFWARGMRCSVST